MDSVSGVGVIDKAVGILSSLAERGALGLAELQEASGLPRATAHRIAVALEDHGLIRRDGQGRFELGLALVGLGREAAQLVPVAATARPVLEALRDRTGESVQLYVLDGGGRRCVVSLQSPHGLRWIVPEGSLLPLDRGSAGRVLAAGRGPVRAAWVESVEEREKGVAGVSAPVIDAAGAVVAAVSISGPVERMSRTPGARFGAAVATAAAEIGLRLRG